MSETITLVPHCMSFSCETGTRSFQIRWWCWSHCYEAKWEILHLTARSCWDLHVHVATDSWSKVQEMGLGSCGGDVLVCLCFLQEYVCGKNSQWSLSIYYINSPIMLKALTSHLSIQDWVFSVKSSHIPAFSCVFCI